MTGRPGAIGRHDRLRLRPVVYGAVSDQGEQYLLTPRTGASIGRLTPAQQRLLQELAGEPVTVPQLRTRTGAPPAETDALLCKLLTGGWLTITVAAGDQPQYTITPHRAPPAPSPPPVALELSRFAVIRRTGSEFTVDGPSAWSTVTLHDPALLAELGNLRSATEPDGGDRARLAYHLWWAGLATAPGVEDGELRWQQWHPHELWFHQHTRAGDRHRPTDPDFATTEWGKGRFDPLPARPEPYSAAVVELPRPDPAALRASDPTLADVLERRRTSRDYDDRCPLALPRLAELLYRCGHTRAVWSVDGLEHQARPYPAGGSFHELELYLVVRLVDGLDPAMYHYDSHRHRLVTVTGPNRATRCLLETARGAVGGTQLPQLLLVVSARFGRVMWKYEQLSYALILKHVGVLYQTVYLAAAASGIGVCALGVGDADAFAEATGRDPLIESSVGELILGGLPAAGPQPASVERGDG